jgi:hypothetical protein
LSLTIILHQVGASMNLYHKGSLKHQNHCSNLAFILLITLCLFLSFSYCATTTDIFSLKSHSGLSSNWKFGEANSTHLFLNSAFNNP